MLMNVIWIGEPLSEEIQGFVKEELNLSGNKIATEMARRAILFVIRVCPEEFREAWKDGLLET